MKKFVLSLIAISLLLTGCKKEIPVDYQAENREFQQQLASYPTAEQVFDNIVATGFNQPGEYSLVSIPKGSVIAFQKGEKVYNDTLLQDLTCLMKNGKPVMKDGTPLTQYKGSEEDFSIELFPDKELWTYDELDLYLKPFPLTVVNAFGEGYELQLEVRNYEAFVLFYEDAKETEKFKVLEFVPGYVLTKNGEMLLYGKEGKPWKKRSDG